MSEYTTPTPLIKRLERSRSDKMVAGVSGGLGKYFDIAPAVFRLGFVVLTLLGGAGILVYLAAVIVLPKEGDEASLAEDILKKRRDHPARLVALGLIAVAILSLLARADTWPSAGAAWFLVFMAGLVLLWTSTRRRGVLVAIATFFAVIVAIVVAAVSASFAWFNVSLGDGVGDRTETPAAIAEIPSRYELGIGSLRVDLSRLTTTRPVDVKANVGIGNLKIIVPADAAVSLESHVKAGQIDALGTHDDGRNARVTTGRGAMRIDAEVGAGHIEVVRAAR
jgi:phage shock protein PspC (stress-responsive transcriptional regulator)